MSEPLASQKNNLLFSNKKKCPKMRGLYGDVRTIEFHELRQDRSLVRL
jgi:hypothetical protein